MTYERKLKLAKVTAAIKAGKTQAEAGIEAGYPPKAAGVQVSRLMRDGRSELEKEYRAHGLDEKRVVKEVKRGLDKSPGAAHLGYVKVLREDLGYAQEKDGRADVSMSKEAFRDLCLTFWNTRPSGPIAP